MQSVDIIVGLPVLLCDRCEEGQRHNLLQLVCRKFRKPLFKNYAVDYTDEKCVARLYQRRPLHRAPLMRADKSGFSSSSCFFTCHLCYFLTFSSCIYKIALFCFTTSTFNILIGIDRVVSMAFSFELRLR